MSNALNKLKKKAVSKPVPRNDGQNNEGDLVDNSTPAEPTDSQAIWLARKAELLTLLQGPEMLAAEQAEGIKRELAQLDILLEELDPITAEELAKVKAEAGIDLETEAEVQTSVKAELDKHRKPSGLGPNSIPTGESVADSCVPVAATIDYNAKSDAPTEVDYDKEVTITVGDILDLHRKLSYCLRGNQRPAVLSCQQLLLRLLPEGTPIIHREPIG